METAQGAIMKHITEAPEDDMPASPDEASMALDQAKFIQYVGEEIEDYIEEGNEFPEWMQNKLSGLYEKAKDMHAVMAGKYEGVQESLRKDIASLASQFPKGTKVKVKNARKYDALQKDGVKGEVIGNGKDFIMVAVGKGQMNVYPKDLVKESLDEATLYLVKMRDGTKHKRTMDTATAEKMKKNPKVLSVSVIGNVQEAIKFTDKQIKMAYGILNDPRYKRGNLTGAIDKIEKIAKGLSDHPGVQKAMKATSEQVQHIDEKLKVSDGIAAWIKDFQDSDAPQFDGKSAKERRDMAIAAYLSAKKGPQK